MYDTMMQTTIAQPPTNSSTPSAHVGAQVEQKPTGSTHRPERLTSLSSESSCKRRRSRTTPRVEETSGPSDEAALALAIASIMPFKCSSLTGPLSRQCARCARIWSLTFTACKPTRDTHAKGK